MQIILPDMFNSASYHCLMIVYCETRSRTIEEIFNGSTSVIVVRLQVETKGHELVLPNFKLHTHRQSSETKQ